MYANVPCYHLAELHEAIKHDLPPSPNGIVEVWRVIIDALEKQASNKAHACKIELPKKNGVQKSLKGS